MNLLKLPHQKESDSNFAESPVSKDEHSASYDYDEMFKIYILEKISIIQKKVLLEIRCERKLNYYQV